MSSPTEPKYPHVVVPLLGQDGNATSIMFRVSRALKAAGEYEAAREYVTAAFGAPSYDEMLALTLEYVREASLEDADAYEADDENEDLCVECGEEPVYVDGLCEDCAVA